MQYDDPRILRAIAHPSRNRILSELNAAGSLRAADVARLLDVPANQASFHLRQLAKYGLVEEAPEEARDKRDRVWRLVDVDGIRFRTQDVLAQPGGEAAVDVFRRHAIAWGHRLVDLINTPAEAGQERWIWDGSLRLSQDELVEFAADYDALVERWRERTRKGGDRTTYSVYQLAQPYPDGAEAPEPARIIGFGTGDQ
jgi:DNA-binding transcriptional ArsR family regulator